ncbi:ferredoxin [Photobacterium kishitanii]|uniref:Ferredoxin n=1 Tax=Photobacterium kishitanii TaxID=318456 RepID=A0A0B7J753_9GAMM|nr:2Fe-2S iron-sulfur cluster-binding protein [Photobacterium kishitanii]KJG06682.1 ferredoxin [Photobacterium kishitanii]OBU25730.1 ferredoxin [Photobacterium kishitanii]OBU31035.1 ferredoxin [Photobacterium kishitanii]PSU16175.1 ferredoxin [Photobacterium kishitanii]PSU90203.1 ferredoxin [Photobacterium kishitanii]
MYQVRLLPNNITFAANAQQTVLQAALDAGIAFPNRCQVGACAMCMCRKQQGQISYVLEPMLTPQEQAQGWIFACQARVESDLVLSLD